MTSWFSRHRWKWAVAALLYVLYAGLSSWQVPRLVRQLGTDYVSQQMQRKLTLGEVSFNPFTITLSLQDVALQEADGAPIAGWGLLRVNVSLWGSLLHRAIAFDEIDLETPQVQALLRPDGRLNLAELVLPKRADAPPAADDAPLPALRIARLSVREGRVAFEDQTRAKPVKAVLAPISFALEDFQTSAGHENAYQFAGSTPAGEKLSWSGNFTVQPLGSQGRFQIAGLQMATLMSWLPDDLPVQLPAGVFDAEGQYTLKLGGAEPALTLDLPTLSLRELALAPRGAAAGDAPWVQLPEFKVTQTHFSLADRRVQVQQISVQGLHVNLQRRADGKLNLLQLLEAWPQAKAEPAQAPAPESKAGGKTGNKTANKKTAAPAQPAWNITVQEIALHEGRLDFSDQTTQPAAQLTLAPINVSLRNYQSGAAAAPMPLSADVGLLQGKVTAEGTLRAQPLDAQVKLTLDALNLKALQPYLTHYTGLDLRSALLAAQLQVQYAEPSASLSTPQLKVAGDVQLNQFDARDRVQEQPLLSWKQLQVRGLAAQLGPDRWRIDQIRLQQPYARVAIAQDGSLNVSRALHAPGAEAAPVQPAPAPAASKPVAPTPPAVPAAVTPAQIREILVEDATADFSDLSLQPNFSTGIYKLQGKVTGLSSEPGSRAQVQFDGSVDRYAPVSIRGELNLLSAVSYSDLTLLFSNMDLTTFNPYAGKFAGYNIERGKLRTELHYQLNDRKLDAQHHVVLDQLEFGDATESKDAPTLPVKLAVALLQDRDGVIDLNLPVTGSLDDPEFRIGPLVWKVLTNLLTKAVTAPFSLLGSLFGGGEDLQYIDFAPGSSQPDAAQQAKLDKLVKALQARPKLHLDVPLGAADARDDTALAQQALEAASGIQAGTPAASRLAALEGLYSARMKKTPSWTGALAASAAGGLTPALLTARGDWLQQQLLPLYAPPAGAREALARSRAENVRAFLVERGQLAAERIFLAARAPTGAMPEQTVRMELKLN